MKVFFYLKMVEIRVVSTVIINLVSIFMRPEWLCIFVFITLVLNISVMCNFMGVRISKIEFIRLKRIEKELGTLAALQELQLIKDGFLYSNSAIVRKVRDKDDIEVVSAHWEFIPVWVKLWEDVQTARKQGIPG